MIISGPTDIENEVYRAGFRLVAGVDEAGRGPLAGPVVAAAVIFPPGAVLPGVTDSKKLTESARERLIGTIRNSALSIGVGIVDHETIDRINILRAALLAMKRAVENGTKVPEYLLVDGIHSLDLAIPQRAVPKGDSRCLAVAAASIVAKVTRDGLMGEYHRQFPGYRFDRHKGYGTKEHLERIRKLGPCSIHRKTFKGVKELVAPPVPLDGR
jgi:ribonuclease HII